MPKREEPARKTIAVIPARMESRRLPGKPLAIIAGKTMLEHVYERSMKAAGVSRVIVATDSDDIFRAVESFGGEAVMTGKCRSGSDRVAEAAASLDCSIVVNVQGDEPLLPPEMVEQVVAPFQDDSVVMTTLRRRFREDENPSLPQAVKVVTDLKDDALYFSRSLVPFSGTGATQGETRGLNPLSSGEGIKGLNPLSVSAAGAGPFLHVGIYAFRRDFLLEYARLPSGPLEKAEKLEQLRALEHGYKIRTPATELFSMGVDTPEDLERARKIMGKMAGT